MTSGPVLIDLDLAAQDEWTPAFSSAEGGLSALEARLGQLEAAALAADGALASVAESAAALALPAAADAQAVTALTVVIEENTAAMTENAGATEAASLGYARLSTSGASLGASMPIAAAALGLVAAEAVKLSAGFDLAMNKIEAMAGVAPAAIGKLKDQVRDLSNQTGESTQQLAQGLYYIVSAGFQGADAMTILAQTTREAQAAQTDAKPVADATTSALKAYGLQASDTGHVLDVLHATVVNGKMEFAGLASSIGRVLPIAAQSGVSLEELGANIATLTQKGLSASEAVTGVRAALLNLEAPSKQTRDALAALGLSADEVRQSIRDRGLLATLDDLVQKTHGNVDELHHLFPNIRALTDVLGTAGGDLADYKRNLDAVTNSYGVSGKAAQEYSDTTAAAFERAATRVKNAWAELGDGIVAGVKKGNDFLTGTPLGRILLGEGASVVGPLADPFLGLGALGNWLFGGGGPSAPKAGTGGYPMPVAGPEGQSLDLATINQGRVAMGQTPFTAEDLVRASAGEAPIARGFTQPVDEATLKSIDALHKLLLSVEDDKASVDAAFASPLPWDSGHVQSMTSEADGLKVALEQLKEAKADASQPVAEEIASDDTVRALSSEAAALLDLRDKGQASGDQLDRLSQLQQVLIPQARDHAQGVNTLASSIRTWGTEMVNGNISIDRYNQLLRDSGALTGPYAQDVGGLVNQFAALYDQQAKVKQTQADLKQQMSDVATSGTGFMNTGIGLTKEFLLQDQESAGAAVKGDLEQGAATAKPDLSTYNSSLLTQASAGGLAAAGALQAQLDRKFTANATLTITTNHVDTYVGNAGYSVGLGPGSLPAGTGSVPGTGFVNPGRGYASAGESAGAFGYESEGESYDAFGASGGSPALPTIHDYVAEAARKAKPAARARGSGAARAKSDAAAIRAEVRQSVQDLQSELDDDLAAIDEIINPDGKNALVARIIQDIHNPDSAAGIADATTTVIREALAGAQGGANVSVDTLVSAVWARLSKGVTDPAKLAQLQADMQPLVDTLTGAAGPLAEIADSTKQQNALTDWFDQIADPTSLKSRARGAEAALAGGNTDVLSTILFGSDPTHVSQSMLSNLAQLVPQIQKAIFDAIDPNDPQSVAKAQQEMAALEKALQQEADSNPIVISTTSAQLQATYQRDKLNATAANKPAPKMPVDIDSLAAQIVQALGTDPIDFGVIVGLYLQAGEEIGTLDAAVQKRVTDAQQRAIAAAAAANAAGQQKQLTARTQSALAEASDESKVLDSIAKNEPIAKRAVDVEAIAQQIVAAYAKDPPDTAYILKLFLSAGDQVGQVYDRVIKMISDAGGDVQKASAALQGLAENAAGQTGQEAAAAAAAKAAAKHTPAALAAQEQQDLLDQGIKALAKYGDPILAAQNTGYDVPIPGLTLEQANGYRKNPNTGRGPGQEGLGGGGRGGDSGPEIGLANPISIGGAAYINPYGGVAALQQPVLEALGAAAKAMQSLVEQQKQEKLKPMQVHVISVLDGRTVGYSVDHTLGGAAEMAGLGMPFPAGGPAGGVVR
ncbi:MAG TPA: phage tail tape measure protein [Dehalococcoidia bacterium]|nr:phage tail tape measure protein [Dehalococcoidia bacterium]